ncbi:MAG TPA: hypothetical protein VER33_17690, partial [Polyangiaceae bacterium]|nr:hypothetical protein [Polyangiaceae bacterium]
MTTSHLIKPAFLAASLLFLLPACGAAPEGELEPVASDGEALTLNNDPEQLIVYSQNMAQFGTRGVA